MTTSFSQRIHFFKKILGSKKSLIVDVTKFYWNMLNNMWTKHVSRTLILPWSKRLKDDFKFFNGIPTHGLHKLT